MVDASAAGSPAEPATVPVWDRFVRVFHWSVVAGCAANSFALEGGKLPHEIVGYAVAALVAARLVWGFVGTRHARFVDFVPGPATLAAHLKALLQGREPRTRGHNPAAAVMILALMAVLAVLGVTGWMTTLDAFWGAEWLEETHELLADALQLMVLVHAAAAVLESLRHRENLVLAMITGRKRP
ncbi:cytochrome B [Azospirillum sp. RWY-5-1]|uniref:Cytochrome B n=1 Tax=Azospirillum oleiclasticum TaxID=2735135 RepID=A0ABX2T793_9PROT|nr:cytochrome b/b6 domain-containing protein [Azospirillum oleiclasticum]NYZ11971.1 cytochrome B [Azospirillum oleiclasticum]NYZ19131.1 cytochrome B [Azospirillum oleiclasticum]